MVASLAKLDGGNVGYYLEKAAVEDYYLGTEAAPAERPGEWFGEGAEQFGLFGNVKEKDLRALFHGFSPDGEPLVQNAGREDRRAGFDLCLSLPKSMSVLYASGSEEVRRQVEAAQEEAVKAALRYVEQTCGFTRRGKGGAELEKVGLTVATFMHLTSREGDPNIHTHCLVMNVAKRHDGSYGTLEGGLTFRHKMTSGAVYHAELARQLEQRLGVVVERHSEWFELSGVPRSLMKEMSKRSSQIEAFTGSVGPVSAQAKAKAALATRESKENVPLVKLQERWQKEALAHGFTAEAVESLLYRQPPRQDVAARLDACLNEALERVTRQQAHFSERELVRWAAVAAQDKGLGAELVLHGVGRTLERSGEVVKLGEVKGEVRYTTKEILDLERAMLDSVERLCGSGTHRVSEKSVAKAFSSRPTMTDEQKRAVLHITQGVDQVGVCIGMAGTGKSYMLGSVKDAFERDGYRVIGCALSGKAAEGLEEGSGIKSYTIAKLIGAPELNYRGDLQRT